MPRGEAWILIDSSCWVHALRADGSPAIREQVRKLIIEGRAATCEIIVLELMGGTRTSKEFNELYEELMSLKQLPIDEGVWRQAYLSAHTLRSKGISVPAIDQLIASVGLAYACSILHQDKHFDLMAKYLHVSVHSVS